MTEILLAIVALLGIGSLLLSGRSMRIPPLCACCVISLLLIGWYSTLSPRSAYLPEIHAFIPTPYSLGIFAGTVDQTASIEWMVRITLLLCVFLVAADLTANRAWLRALLWSMSFTGLAMASVGILEKLGFINVYGQIPPLEQFSRFSAFWYHGNAGAFLNLVMPACYGLIRSRSAGRTSVFGRLMLEASMVLCIAAAFVNVSRAAQVITVGVLFAMGLPLIRSRKGRPAVAFSWLKFTCAVLVLMVILAAAGSAAFHRWHSVGQQLGQDSPRAVLDRICMKMAMQAGLFGYGPGTFKILLPLAPDINTLYVKWIVTWYVPGTEIGIWSNADNDYLQTIIEWGWLGAFIWCVLIAAGFIRALARVWRNKGVEVGGESAIFYAAIIAIVATAVHSTVDSPLQILPLQLYFVIYLAIAWSVSGPGRIATFSKKTPQSSGK